MDAGLDQNKAELGVFVFSIAFEVLSDGDGLVKSAHTRMKNHPRNGLHLLDQHVEVLRYLGCEAYVVESLRQSKDQAEADFWMQFGYERSRF